MNLDIETIPQPRVSLKVGYFLTDLPREGMGNLVGRAGESPRRAARRVARRPESTVEIVADAGDAVIFDRRLWHAASTNTSDRRRVFVTYGYSYRWLRTKSASASRRPVRAGGPDSPSTARGKQLGERLLRTDRRRRSTASMDPRASRSRCGEAVSGSVAESLAMDRGGSRSARSVAARRPGRGRVSGRPVCSSVRRRAETSGAVSAPPVHPRRPRPSPIRRCRGGCAATSRRCTREVEAFDLPVDGTLPTASSPACTCATARTRSRAGRRTGSSATAWCTAS